MAYSSINSNGVQITGGSYPEALQMASIFGLITLPLLFNSDVVVYARCPALPNASFQPTRSLSRPLSAGGLVYARHRHELRG